MVGLPVVHSHHVDVLRVDSFPEIVDKLRPVRRPDCVYKHGLAILDKIYILAGSVHYGEAVSVELLKLPVQVPDPAYVAPDFSSSARF
jgi:hypothetical protein